MCLRIPLSSYDGRLLRFKAQGVCVCVCVCLYIHAKSFVAIIKLSELGIYILLRSWLKQESNTHLQYVLHTYIHMLCCAPVVTMYMTEYLQ